MMVLPLFSTCSEALLRSISRPLRHFCSEGEVPGRKLITRQTKKIRYVRAENQRIFGDLVESKKDKRKRQTRDAILQSQGLDLTVNDCPVAESDARAAEIEYVMRGASIKLITKRSQFQAAQTFPAAGSRVFKKKPEYTKELPKPKTIPYPRTTTATRLPSVTRILQDTMPAEQKAILEKWEARMKAELGEEGFANYKKSFLTNGRDLHDRIQTVLKGVPEDEIEIPPPIRGHWRSLRTVVFDLKDVKVLESLVVHPTMNYCGIIDCVAHFRECLVLIDWKTSEKPKPVVSMTYDAPLQVAAYIAAINEDPNYDLDIREGLIVVAYQNGQPCERFFLTERDVSIQWERFEKRLNEYKRQVMDVKMSLSSEKEFDNKAETKTKRTPEFPDLEI